MRLLIISTLFLVFGIVPKQGYAQAAADRETFLYDFHLHDGSYKKLGFRIEKIKRGSLYARIGLINGDIIKKVNQQAIGNSMDAKHVFQKLKTLKTIDLVVVRNGQQIPLHYDAFQRASNRYTAR